MGKKNIFVVGLNEFNLRKLQAIKGADNYSFHGLLPPADVVETYHFPMEQLLRAARNQLDSFPGSIDAIVGYWDFPISTMLPLLCGEYDVRGSSLESVLMCEHKYWSRLKQKEVLPDYIPHFQLFDPFDDNALGDIDLPYPFWIKPVKSCGSFLGFKTRSASDFRRGVETIRDNIHLISGPFDYIRSHADLPEEVASVGGDYCMAESLIGGRQCTLDGYVLDGDMGIYGVVDSIRARNRSSFLRYQYPSQIPWRIQQRMEELTKTILHHVGFDNSGFNIEFFWNERTDHIWLLEINTRITQSHSDIYEKVDGISNHQIMVDVALGHIPELPRRQGQFNCAAKFFLRTDQDAIVEEVPGEEEILRVERAIPGTVIQPQVQKGMKLSHLFEQDSYTYAIAHIFIGGRNQAELLERYRKCVSMLEFKLAPLTEKVA